LLINPEIVYVSQFARFYTFLLFIGLCAIYFIIISEKNPTRQHALGLFVILTFLLFSHYSAMFVFGSIMVYLLFKKRPCWKFVCSGVLALFCFLPWIFYSLRVTNPSTNLSLLKPSNIMESLALLIKISGTIQIFSRNQIENGIFVLPGLISLITLFLVIAGIVSVRDKGRIFIILIIFPIVATTILMLFKFKSLPQITRYFITSVAAQAAVYSIFLTSRKSIFPKLRSLGLLFLIIMNLGGLLGYFFNDNGCFYVLKSGIRETTQTIEKFRLPEDKVYYSGGWFYLKPFDYYYSGKTIQLNVAANKLDKLDILGPISWENSKLLKTFGINPEDSGYWLYLSNGSAISPQEHRFINILDQLMRNKEEVPTRKGILLHYTP